GHFTRPEPSAPSRPEQFSAAGVAALTRMHEEGVGFRQLTSAEQSAVRQDLRTAARTWTANGGGEAFLRETRALAAAAAAAFGEGDPRRATALAGAYEALAERYFVHIG